MTYFEHGKSLWQFTTTSPTGTAEWHVECLDSRDPDGFFGVAVVSSAGSEIRFADGSAIPLEVLQHWLSLLPDPLEPESDG